MSKPWQGTKHTCPECEACAGVYFHSNYTGVAVHPNQTLASIPFHPTEGRKPIKAF